MLDTLGLVVLVGLLPLTIAVLAWALPGPTSVRIWLAALLIMWFGWTAFAPPAGVLGGIGGPIVLCTILLLSHRRWQQALADAVLPVLIALHVSRLAGGFFLLLNNDGRLANPFAGVAGWGDIAAAVLAVPVAIIAYRQRAGWTGWVLAWNVLGLIDFVVAVALGVTSQPGTPIRVFMEPPGAAILGQLPWRFIPAFYVPLLTIVHIGIFIRLWRGRTGAARQA
jgi:hypothetical protein